MYWQPFVDRLVQDLKIAPERIIPLTRSGAHIWYRAPKAVELYGMRSVQDVRVQNRLRQMRTGMVKQMAVTPFDRQVYRDAAETMKLDKFLTLHPAWMYQTLQPFWNGFAGLAATEQALRFAPLPLMDLPTGLPDKYVAVSFYARATWEPTTMTGSFAKEAIGMIARQIPVILLTSGIHLDDHTDYIPKPLPENVFLLHNVIQTTPQNALAVKASVIAKAQAFVGTYGGLSHVALRYGIPSVNLFTEWKGIFLAHRQLSEALALQTQVPYHILKLGEVPILQDTLPRVVLESASSSKKELAPSEQTV